jgi:hypothetical protein
MDVVRIGYLDDFSAMRHASVGRAMGPLPEWAETRRGLPLP